MVWDWLSGRVLAQHIEGPGVDIQHCKKKKKKKEKNILIFWE
jgi:hypothetical protein